MFKHQNYGSEHTYGLWIYQCYSNDYVYDIIYVYILHEFTSAKCIKQIPEVQEGMGVGRVNGGELGMVWNFKMDQLRKISKDTDN